MKKMKKRSNGFTLTELAIVIAVIAILIAVLVPTFVSLINSANESSDKQLVKNINTALSVDEAINGEVNTMSDALAVAAENGYNVDKLTPASSGDIVWDQDSNRFLLINEEGEIVYYDSSVTSASITDTKYKLWYIAQSSSDLGGDYSYYLNYTVASDETIEVTTGIDVGSNEGINVVYSTIAEQDVVIRTNGGTLTITAANSSVAHYGTSSSVNITAVKTQSYHLYGTIEGNLYVYSGRVVAESGSSVSTILALNTQSSTIIVEVSSSSDVKSVKTYGTVDTTGSSVTAQVITTEEADIMEYFAGGSGGEESPYQISSEAQLRAIGVLDMSSSDNSYYFELTKDITIYRTGDDDYIVDYFNGTFNGNGYSITVAVANDAKVTGGDDWGYGSYWFFTYPVNATVKDLTIYHASGTNIAITCGWYNATSTLTFENVNMGDTSTQGVTLEMARNTSGYIQYFNGSALTFSGCKNYYNLSSNNPSCHSGVFIGGYYSCSISGNYVNSNNETKSGVVGFFKQTITFENCENYGNVTCANGGIFVGNASYTKMSATMASSEVGTYAYATLYSTAAEALTVTVTGCTNTGNAYFYNEGGLYSKDQSTCGTEDIVNAGCTNTGTITTPGDSTLNIEKNSSGTYTITKAENQSTYTYKFLYMSSASWKLNNATGSQYMTLTFELTNIEFDSSNKYATTYKTGVKFYDIDSYIATYQSSNTSWKSSVEWTLFSQVKGCNYYYDTANNCYVFDYSGTSSGKTYTMASSSITACVAIYDSNENLLAMKTI